MTTTTPTQDSDAMTDIAPIAGAAALHDQADEALFERIRSEFPAANQMVHGKPLAYLDAAASALTPEPVIDAIDKIYREDRANVHRGVHVLSQRATKTFEAARESVRKFIGAAATEEIIFTRGTTEAINLVAATWGATNLSAGDEILLSGLEHHSNIVPWQMLCERTGAVLVVAPIEDDGYLPLDTVRAKLGDRTKLVAMAHVSNALGTVLPVREIAELAHARGALVLLDGAQAAPHVPVDVQALDCDFYALSGHKLYGPTGIGVLYGKKALLEAMPPYQGGGDMILSVTFDKTTYNSLPYKFEAGTPNIAGAAGLGAACEYVQSIGWDKLLGREQALMTYATEALRAIPGLTLIGTAPHKVASLSFTMDCAHPHDIGTIVDSEGVAIRTGHHCAQPVMERFGIAATARASLGMYNNRADIDALVRALGKVRELFA